MHRSPGKTDSNPSKSPYTDILQRMETRISDWKSREDQRHVFLSCYRLMTGNMLEAIDRGGFQDRRWVSDLLHHFADYYFDALTCFECGDRVPLVWQQVHLLTTRQPLHRLQFLLLGINAHINYDLVLTLYDMLAPEWSDLSESQQEKRYADHCQVNTIIADTIDQVQDDILERDDRFMALIDRAFGRLDEYLLSRLIRNWRQGVWEEAQRMLAAKDARQREHLRGAIEAEVMRRAKLLAFHH